MTTASEQMNEFAGAVIGIANAVAWKIHPAIGFARVGNSPSEFLVAGSTCPPHALPNLEYRDKGDPGALRLPGIKRQAALFGVFAYDSSGNCLGEVTAQSPVQVQWGVTLANKKASASKISEPRGASRVRNPQIASHERWKLEITPQPRRVSGIGQKALLDDGRFIDSTVCLGEIRTDPSGRLLVLGGTGRAGTYDAAKRIVSPTDNDYWFDDVSDGPVTATLTLLDGRRVDAAPAWVIVTPPDFAPGIQSIATQFDILVDQAVRSQRRAIPNRPSFLHDIFPILRRISAMQWLNRRALVNFGNARGALDLESMVRTLAANGDTTSPTREVVLDAIVKQQESAIGWLNLTSTQFELLRRWAVGDFEADWSTDYGSADLPGSIEKDPELLDRTALDACAGATALFDSELVGDIFLPGRDFRIDHAKASAGSITRSMPCPWHAGLAETGNRWELVNCPREVLTPAVFDQVRALDDQIAALGQDDAEVEASRALQQRRDQLWMTRESWARGLPEGFPARAESLIKEWQHLGFVSAHVEAGRIGGPTRILVELDRSPQLGSLAEYFHRLVNIEENSDFAPKALEIAYQMLGDAKFTVDENYAPFRYTPDAFDKRLEEIYDDRVRGVMYCPVSWESGKLTWNAVADYDDYGDPIWKRRRFDVGGFSDAALRERFFQFAPENMTDGAWLQNIVAAAPTDDVQSRLARIWFDEVGGGRVDQCHANIYAALMHSLNIWMPPVTSHEFIEQGFVPSAFLSPVFQFCVGLFPKRFFPELLGMTLFMEWEATPVSTAIANMMAERHMDPQYYRMHAGIDNITAGHGALAKEAVKLYLSAKLHEGGDAIMQAHWQRIWRGYVAWATLGNGHDEVVERMMLIDRKQIHIGPSLLTASDILPPFVDRLRKANDPVSLYLRAQLRPATRAMLTAGSVTEVQPGALVDALREDMNRCLRQGIYDCDRFSGIQLSASTAALLGKQPLHDVDLIDLNRCLLEDAYPDGIARRNCFPDFKHHCASQMIALINRKAALAQSSHRRVEWLSEVFHEGPDAVMHALLKRGFIDLKNPRLSRLFAKTEFGGPMFRVFSEEDKRTIVDWVESVRTDASVPVRPQMLEAGVSNYRIPGLMRRPCNESEAASSIDALSFVPEIASDNLSMNRGSGVVR